LWRRRLGTDVYGGGDPHNYPSDFMSDGTGSSTRLTETPLSAHLIHLRGHHRDPTGMTHHGFLELTGNSFLAYVLPLALVWWFGPASPESGWGVFNYTLWVSFTIALTMTNQLHCWAHQSSPVRFARWLQRCGFAISASHHARHHAPPHRSAYCITNGWTNRLADRFSVFAHLEKLFVAIGVPRTTSRS
jgi:ubiquitin-conjugating enzyme E2 variant